MIANLWRYAPHVSSPRARIVAAVAGLLVIAAAGLAASGLLGADGSGEYSGALLPAEVPIRDFSLRDESNRAITLASVRGRPSLLTFLFTSCPDFCPLTAQQIRGALDQSGLSVPVTAISVDPAGDTPEKARRWLGEQRMQGRMHWGLGDRATLERVWKDYAVLGQSASSDHSTYVFLLDRDGRRCVSWPVSHLTPEGLAHDLRLISSRDGRCRE